MHLKSGFFRRLLPTLVILAATAGFVRYASHRNFPVIHASIQDATYGRITMARPLFSYQSLAVIFAGAKTFHPRAMATRLAKKGISVAIIDADYTMKSLTDNGKRPLATARIAAPVRILAKWSHATKDTYSILVGIGNGALLPFLSAATATNGASMNLSIGFSAALPDTIRVGAPFVSEQDDGHRRLIRSPALKEKWLSVWTDQPDDDTALFIRGLQKAQTNIAPYDTPLETVAVNEIEQLTVEAHKKQADAVPTVALPTKVPNPVVTLFYSGDGGWRDLDRDVGGMLAKRGYPVVGVDTLRYFWSRKSVATAADDLSKMMQQYRSSWKARSFVLAGYSFGADILPAIYNRLPKSDKKDVDMLILLAPGKTYDLEIHVSGWVEKNTDGLPLLPQLKEIPGNKILCIYGKEEKDDTACSELSTPKTRVLELPGGHHFNHNYPDLVKRLLAVYKTIGLKKNT